jgi:hypothetical protein
MSQLTQAQQLTGLLGLTAGGSPYYIPIDFTNISACSISCISTAVGGAVLTLQVAVDGFNYVTVPAADGGNPVALSAAATTIFNIREGILPTKYVRLSLVVTSGTMGAFTVSVNTRTSAIVHQ